MINFLSPNTQMTPAQEILNQVFNGNRMTLDSLIIGYENSFRNIWDHEHELVQQIFDELGEDAPQLFQVSKATQDFIKVFKPDYNPPIPPYRFSIDKDGRVTVHPNIIS